jgi:Family of unknown function (DUF6260)
MRYFDANLVANSRLHAQWWGDLTVNREHFHRVEEAHAALRNSAAILPRDAWQELDAITRRVMRNDEGRAYMADLMPLAKPVNIGKLVHLNRVSSDAGTVNISMSGQVPNSLDKVEYDYRGNPVPIFSTAYGREWREWNTLQSENFDALADDQEAHVAKINRTMAQYALDGDANIKVGGYTAYGIRNHPLSQAINLGNFTGGANIDLTTATSDAIENFVNNVLGEALDDNYIAAGVNMYVSPEIARNLDKPYSGSAGFKIGSLRDVLLANRRITKIATTFELTGNEFFAFVPSAEYIRPLVGMAVGTTAQTRVNPTDNYQFVIMGAMGIEVRADYNNRSGVFYSVVINS